MKARLPANYSLWAWFIHALAHFSHFSGRSPRKAFWGFHIFAAVFYFIIAGIGAFTIGERVYTVLSLYQLFLFLPSLALLFRRLHDTGRSGWYSLPLFVMTACSIWLQMRDDIPVAYGIYAVATIGFVAAASWLYILIVCGFFKSRAGANQYGIPPYEQLEKERPDDLAFHQA